MVGALAVLPLFDALLAFVCFPILWWLGGHEGRPADPAAAARAFALLAGALGLLVTAGGAIPVVEWLRRRRALTLGSLSLAGLALGNAPFALYALFIDGVAAARLVHGSLSEHLLPMSELAIGAGRALAVGSTFGVASAVVFWVLGVRSRS
jgi:hypothetical protein